MILSFKTKINGKPTHFVEKIMAGCAEFIEHWLMIPEFKNYDWNKYYNAVPKIHTIREDKNNRWKPGVMIDFFINARTKNMERFAPKIPVISIQKIKIIWDEPFSSVFAVGSRQVGVILDGCLANDLAERLAINDGFESVEEFFDYFNEDFEGKIIHWTDLKY